MKKPHKHSFKLGGFYGGEDGDYDIFLYCRCGAVEIVNKDEFGASIKIVEPRR